MCLARQSVARDAELPRPDAFYSGGALRPLHPEELAEADEWAARAILAGCHIEPLGDIQARAAGTLAGSARTTDIVDACVVEGALRRRDLVITSDLGDLAAIAATTGHHLDIDYP